MQGDASGVRHDVHAWGKGQPKSCEGTDPRWVFGRLFWRPSCWASDGIALETKQLGLVDCHNGARLHGQPTGLAFTIAAGLPSLLGLCNGPRALLK